MTKPDLAERSAARRRIVQAANREILAGGSQAGVRGSPAEHAADPAGAGVPPRRPCRAGSADRGGVQRDLPPGPSALVPTRRQWEAMLNGWAPPWDAQQEVPA